MIDFDPDIASRLSDAYRVRLRAVFEIEDEAIEWANRHSEWGDYDGIIYLIDDGGVI